VDVDDSVTLRELGHSDDSHANMTAAQYIIWRSGEGDGVAFHPGDQLMTVKMKMMMMSLNSS
jgi:hypothetical protein